MKHPLTHETYVNDGDARLWTVTQGAGVPIILSNGGPGCCDYLDPVAAMVDDVAQVVRWEQRGCGRSSQTPPYDIAACLADLEAIRRHYGFERLIVGGHSWGADLALIYALEYPKRTHAIICIAGGRIHNNREWHKAYRQGKEAGLETPPVFAYPTNTEVNEQITADWKRFIQQPTLLLRLSRLSVPALFVYGEADIRPSWPVQQVANLLANGRFHSIPSAPHYIWRTHPTPLRNHLRQFLQERS